MYITGRFSNYMPPLQVVELGAKYQMEYILLVLHRDETSVKYPAAALWWVTFWLLQLDV